MNKFLLIILFFYLFSCTTHNKSEGKLKIEVISYDFDYIDGLSEDCSRNSIYINCKIFNLTDKELEIFDKTEGSFICDKSIVAISDNERFELVLINNISRIPKNSIDTLKFLIKNFTFVGSKNQLEKEFKNELQKAKQITFQLLNGYKFKFKLKCEVPFNQTHNFKKVMSGSKYESIKPNLLKDSIVNINFIIEK